MQSADHWRFQFFFYHEWLLIKKKSLAIKRKENMVFGNIKSMKKSILPMPSI